jgi:hypothetical protein
MNTICIELQSIPHEFESIKNNLKNFIILKNERFFKIDSEILFKEFVPEHYYEDQIQEYYTGRICHRKIIFIIHDKYKQPLFGQVGLEKDYIILCLAKI